MNEFVETLNLFIGNVIAYSYDEIAPKAEDATLL